MSESSSGGARGALVSGKGSSTPSLEEGLFEPSHAFLQKKGSSSPSQGLHGRKMARRALLGKGLNGAFLGERVR
ncbi:hypothetical protein CDL15_Pgr021843 [Punica granatum]|uniref:Uncharacterized protein n=1 Tax=Punica granatum TaxID=22663 RepID=A0A218WT58_PUNGR|nr:hypothetical protein CDL15_Pgr021843 [Punica granatum]